MYGRSYVLRCPVAVSGTKLKHLERVMLTAATGVPQRCSAVGRVYCAATGIVRILPPGSYKTCLGLYRVCGYSILLVYIIDCFRTHAPAFYYFYKNAPTGVRRRWYLNHETWTHEIDWNRLQANPPSHRGQQYDTIFRIYYVLYLKLYDRVQEQVVLIGNNPRIPKWQERSSRPFLYYTTLIYVWICTYIIRRSVGKQLLVCRIGTPYYIFEP